MERRSPAGRLGFWYSERDGWRHLYLFVITGLHVRTAHRVARALRIAVSISAIVIALAIATAVTTKIVGRHTVCRETDSGSSSASLFDTSSDRSSYSCITSPGLW